MAKNLNPCKYTIVVKDRVDLFYAIKTWEKSLLGFLLFCWQIPHTSKGGPTFLWFSFKVSHIWSTIFLMSSNCAYGNEKCDNKEQHEVQIMAVAALGKLTGLVFE